MYTEPSRGSKRVDRATIAWMLVIFLLGLFGSYVYFDWREEQRYLPVRADAGSDASATEGGPGGASGEAGGSAGNSSPGASDSVSGPIGGVDAEINGSRRTALVAAAARAAPAVVSILVYQTRLVTTGPRTLDEFFEYYYSPQSFARSEVVPSAGSGVVVDPAGIVLTNEHVVHGAERIEVVLSDGRVLAARLAGSDPTYDLAILKVESDDPLPSAWIGRTDDLQVGEWAIAIGNPFGLLYYDNQSTVTVGVISALHRDVRDTSEGKVAAIYKDMIQTDAAINPGNSGGPLVNSLGEVIGINTFVFSQNGTALGIGFAMPIETAVRAAREIIQFGEVRHVDLGIEVVDISAVLATRLHIADRRGLLVKGLERGSPGAEAGIQLADIIRAINGTPVTRAHEARRLIFGVDPHKTINFTIERGGEILEIPVVADLPDSPEPGSVEGEGYQ